MPLTMKFAWAIMVVGALVFIKVQFGEYADAIYGILFFVVAGLFFKYVVNGS
jgi:hypothetical protein